MDNVKERFMRYITYNTQSDFLSETTPSTNGQMVFARMLAKECEEIGLFRVIVSQSGYVYAELPGNIEKETAIVAFIAHMDTSPDCSGEGIAGITVSDYDGGEIQLNETTVLSPKEFPFLLKYAGDDLIVTNGKTLLGADDKAGIAEILTAMAYLVQHREIPHGTVKVCFTPDEEIGRGADGFDLELTGADFAYTVDGGAVGELEFESFNAARAKIVVTGKSVHPGYAKNIMRNATLVAMEIANRFPASETPQATEGDEGFYHFCGITGNVERAEMDYIIRDFSRTGFQRRKAFTEDVVGFINKKYGEGCAVLTMRDEYYNMGDILKDRQYIVELAMRAMKAAGIEPKIKAIRGGTDGSRLSFLGLPCPNIFAGGHNFHGPYECISVQSMIKACQVIAHIAAFAADLSI